MEILYERIRKMREQLNITQDELAKRLGYRSRSSINKIEKGLVDLSQSKIAAFAEALHTTTAYLMGWTDNPDESFTSEVTADPVIPIAKNIIPIPHCSQKVPLLGKIACGVPVLADENIDDYVDLPDNIDADFCLKCVGDSMEGARIMDGDIVYIHQQPMVDDGEIAAVLIDNEATLKRVYYDKVSNTIQLVSENPKYRPFVYHGAQLDEIKIIGRAVAFLSKVRK